ncbi:chitinase, partial [Streptomyces sp. NPDC059627]
MSRLRGRTVLGRLTLGVVLAAVLSALFTVAPAQAATGQITGLAGKCVDVAGASSAHRPPVPLQEIHSPRGEEWGN